jgi:predicted nucleic acid-binding protein
VAVAGWILDNSAAQRFGDPSVAREISSLAGLLSVCRIGRLEQLYSARSASDYDARRSALDTAFPVAEAPEDVFAQAEDLQRDLAHHHGMWHRTPLPDLFIAITALHHGLGVVHVDGDYDRIAEVRPLVARRLG